MLGFIGHVDSHEVKNDEIVAQFAAAVFAALHVRLEIITEQSDIQCQSARLRCVWDKSGAKFPVLA